MTATPLTFLFTDIEGSTYRWDRYPAEMEVALSRHDELLRGAILEHRGHVFKTFGDAFCAAFDTAGAAVAAAVAAQRVLHAESWPIPEGLRVRMALHAGEVQQRDGDYFGYTLSHLSRLLIAGHGGQTLLTRTAGELAQAVLPDRARLQDLGEFLLQDVARPERVFQLVAPGLPADFPPLRGARGARPAVDARRAALLHAAGEQVDPETMQRLVADLGSLDHDRRRQAADTLAGLGGPAVLLLCDVLQTGKPAARTGAAEVLGRIGDARALGTLAGALKDAEGSVRQKAAEALGHIGDARALPSLAEALAAADSSLRWWAAEALGRISDSRAIPVLQEALQDGDRFVRQKVTEALSRMGDAAAPVLARAAEGGDRDLQAMAVGALGRFSGSQALPTLCEVIQSGGPAVRRQAAVSLGELGDPRGVLPLCGALRDAEVAVRRAAAESLAKIADSQAVFALSQSLGDEDPGVRERAAAALTAIGPASAPYLRQAMSEGPPAARRGAAAVLARLGRAAVVPLCDALEDDQPEVRTRAAAALASVAAQSPTPALRAALPGLRRLLAPWSMESEESRRVYQEAVEAIELATDALKDLPLPYAGAGAALEARFGSLPLPVGAIILPSDVPADSPASGPDPNSWSGRFRAIARKFRREE